MKYKAIFVAAVFSLVYFAGYAQTEDAGKSATPESKGRRIISPWFLYDNEQKSIEQVEPLKDILTSISIFGRPSPAFVQYCRKHNIETYYGVFGGGEVFDTQEHRRATIQGYLDKCKELGIDGIDLDLEHLDPALKREYSIFLREASRALHKAGKKLAICVGYYPAMYESGPLKFFYDPKVIGQACDMVRVMCYDMYYAPGKGDKDLMDRGDCQGIGPTSTAPWARDAMKFWLKYVPREKLIMGLPAYSNDYDMTPNGGGAQISRPKPQVPKSAKMDKVWLSYEKINTYRYIAENGNPHIFYASDAKSTQAHLETVDDLNLPGIAFWYYQAITKETWKTVREWNKIK